MKKLLLLVIILMSIVSCGKPEAQKEFEKLVNILQKGDAQELKTIDINFDKKEVFPKIFLTGYKKLTYKVNKTVVKGDVATINVTMKSPDLSVYVEEYMQQLFSIAFVASNMTKQESDELMEKTSTNFFEGKLIYIRNYKFNSKTQSEKLNCEIYPTLNLNSNDKKCNAEKLIKHGNFMFSNNQLCALCVKNLCDIA